MNRVDRLTGMLLVLQGGPKTARELATRFEVSRRTIVRDIDALVQIGVPIVSLPGRNGGYHIAEGYWLPPLQLTPDEATVLLFALDHIGEADRSPLGDAHRSVAEKLRAVMRPDVLTEVSNNLERLHVQRELISPEATTIARLRRAMDEEAWVRISYRSANSSGERAILPSSVYVAAGRWYVRAIDALRIAVRVFRVDRIDDIRPTRTPPDASEIIRQATAGDRAYARPNHPEIHVRLTARGVRFALDHADFRSHVTTDECGAGQVRFRCPPSELPYYGRELLRFGIEAMVLAPTELQTWITDHLATLTEHHDGRGNESERGR